MADIEVTRASGIATVLLNRRASRNAMTLAMWREAGRLFRDLGAGVSEFAAVRDDAAAAVAYKCAPQFKGR